MPHLRVRYAKPICETLLKFSPIVGVFGHRQVGKTTLLEEMAGSYASLDNQAFRDSASRNARFFIRDRQKDSPSGKPVALDESQWVPELFPALKEHVRTRKTPGQFLISGSVRFYSRLAIRESLTGRIVNVELLPFPISELEGLPRPRLILSLLQKPMFNETLEGKLDGRTLKKTHEQMVRYAQLGGLPGICFVRNDKLRADRLRDQLQLILDRDLRLVVHTVIPNPVILEFMSALAQHETQSAPTTRIRKQLGIAEATQKKLLYALEALYVLRSLPIEGDRKGLAYFFEDSAEHSFLNTGGADPEREFVGTLYRNLRASFQYEPGLDYRTFQYRGKPDILVPFAFRTKVGTLGIIPVSGQQPGRRDIRAARRFLQIYAQSNVLLVTQGQPETRVIEPRILQIPAERLLTE
jgi:predicted AAA+ superfamily ATPase